jgi:hypothetical protein
VGRTLVANRWLAGSACGKRRHARPLNSVVRQHADMDTAAEFQQRRRLAGRKSAPWLAIGLIGSSLAFFFGAPESAPWSERAPSVALAFAFFAVAGVGAHIGQKIYRCPNCDATPIRGFGLQFNPEVCPSCGARLK